MAAKKRSRKSKATESESPVTSVEATPLKQPARKKQKTSRKNLIRKLAINDINGRMVTSGTCQINGIVIVKDDVQEKNGRYGRFKFSQCTIMDEAGNSIDIKSYKAKASADVNKYEQYREIQVIFETTNIVRGDLKYNYAANKFHVKNPSRITMAPGSTDKKLAAMTFDPETIKAVKESATFSATKKHLSGIVTQIIPKTFNDKEGLMVRINDETDSQLHVFYEVPENDKLIQEGEFAFIWNATIQQKDNYVNSSGGICLDAKVFKSLKKQEKTLKQSFEKGKLYEWKPKEYIFDEFTMVSMQKANSLARRCAREENFELKEKYKEVVISDVQIEDFENLTSATYLSAKNDGKHKKLTEEEISELTAEEVKHSWMLKMIISNEFEEFRVTLFNAMGDKLMNMLADDWQETSEAKKQKIIERVMKLNFDVYLTFQKKQYQGNTTLKVNVVNVEIHE